MPKLPPRRPPRKLPRLKLHKKRSTPAGVLLFYHRKGLPNKGNQPPPYRLLIFAVAVKLLGQKLFFELDPFGDDKRIDKENEKGIDRTKHQRHRQE